MAGLLCYDKSMQNIPSKKIIWAQIFIIFILPVFILYFKILPLNWRIVLLTVSAIFIYGIIHHEKWTHEEMGLHLNNFKKALPFYLSFTIIAFCFLFLIAWKFNIPDIDTRIFIIKSWAFFIPVSLFQEFAFRSFLIPRLKAIFSDKITIILVNAVLFTLIHIIYPNLGVGLPLAFISGIFFAWLYLKYPNFLLISISHAILNITAVLLGFFAIH